MIKMTDKKITAAELKALKTVVQENKSVPGADSVLKELKAGKLKKVYFASNCPDKIKTDLSRYAQLAKVEVIELSMDNEELGIFCKKNFFISVLGTYE